jgi:signal transduction histidine kinase
VARLFRLLERQRIIPPMKSVARETFDALPATSWTVDLDGRLTSANRSWSRFALANGALSLADESAVRGRSIWEAIDDPAARDEIERAAALIRDGRADQVAWELSSHSPDQERIFLLHLSGLRQGNALEGYVFSTVDITATLRRMEHERRQEATGEVAAGVAQELRNPLFAISSAAQLLRFRAREDPVVEKNVGRILREVERLNRMATSLLEYGRPNPLALHPGDPDTVWDAVIEDERGYLEARSLELRRTRAHPHARCAIDAEQLAQVFVNLLVNAADAAPEASDLTLASELLPTGAWRCRLGNGGPPIPADVLPRVFEIFFSTKAGGTGIGLALCQRIVEAHGGTIGIDSTPAAGTTVTVTLPGA